MKHLLNKIHLADCMDIMAQLPDKSIDLAIVDPPYGVGLDMRLYGSKNAKAGDYIVKEWNDTIPDGKYFAELYRISRNQIIWGCNFYNKFIKDCGRIVWDKKCEENKTFSHVDIASTSTHKRGVIFRYTWIGFIQEDMKNKEKRIHPTQKPVALYRWLLQNYAKEGDLIFDSHSGSGSCAIACIEEGFNYIATEIDADYHKASLERIQPYKDQGRLFA